MKKLILSIAVLALSASAAFAASPTIGVYFDESMSANDASVETLTAFDFHLIVSDIDNVIDAVSYKMTLPAAVAITSTSYNGINNGTAIGNALVGYAVGLGECTPVFNSGSAINSFLFASFSAIALVDVPAGDILLTAFEGGSGPVAASPQFSACDSGVYDMAAVPGTFTAAKVAVEGSSWGGVKALY